MQRWITLSLLGIALAAIAYVVTRDRRAKSAPHITATGGREMDIRLPVSGPHFLQRDGRWRNDPIGGSAESLGSVGCAICSVATAARALGEHLDPQALNRSLIAAGGYTEQGWLIWGALAKVYEGRVEAVVSGTPRHEEMDGALERGEYPIVKIFLPMGIPHWLVLVGKQGREYLAHDPLDETAEPVLLSDRTSAIYSVRYIRRKT